MGLKRFTKPKFLEEMGRENIGQLLGRYETALNGASVTLPTVELGEKEYYAALAKVILGQTGLPSELVDALYALEAMSNENGRERLRRAAEMGGVALELDGRETHAEYALKFFLAHEKVFGKVHDEMQVARMATFDYYTSPEPRGNFSCDPETVAWVKQDVDEWLAENREGEERVTEIETYELDGEHWFLIRRGDSMSRMAVVEGGSVTVKYLRPARDLVVVYNHERNELRVNGKGREIKMICRVFGTRFLGDPDHFIVRKAFTLDPLREDMREALEPIPGDVIEWIRLRELEVKVDEDHDATVITKADDLFAYAESKNERAVPIRGELVRASFEMKFAGEKKTRTIHLKAGNRLRVARFCDAAAIQRWLSERGFRIAERPLVNRIAALNVRLVENN